MKAANGEIIAVGEGYNSKEALVNGIESVKNNAAIARVVEVREPVSRVWKKRPPKPFRREGEK